MVSTLVAAKFETVTPKSIMSFRVGSTLPMSADLLRSVLRGRETAAVGGHVEIGLVERERLDEMAFGVQNTRAQVSVGENA